MAFSIDRKQLVVITELKIAVFYQKNGNICIHVSLVMTCISTVMYCLRTIVIKKIGISPRYRKNFKLIELLNCNLNCYFCLNLKKSWQFINSFCHQGQKMVCLASKKCVSKLWYNTQIYGVLFSEKHRFKSGLKKKKKINRVTFRLSVSWPYCIW